MKDPHQVLTDLSTTTEQRIQASFQLLVENSPESVRLLQEGLLTDPSPIVRHECAYSLGELSLEQGSTALMQAMNEDSEPIVKHEAALALSNLGVATGRETIEQLLDHPDDDVVRTARISLQRLDMKLHGQSLEDLDQSPQEIILDLSAKEEHRIQASFWLMEEGSLASIDILLQALHQETDPIVKHEIIFSLGETASSLVIPHLIEEMHTDPNIFVKHEAALALATIGNVDAEAAIRQLLDHPNPIVAESAEVALERLLS